MFKAPTTHLQQYSFSYVQKIGESSHYKSRTSLISQYVGKHKQFLEETHKLFPQVRQLSEENVSFIAVKDP